MNVRVRTASKPDEPQRSGTVADRYRSLFEIGKGGMGSIEVALERSDGGFERIVALKRMLPEFSRDPRQTAMFLREARLAALLTHPNVVHAFAFGESEGELFLAMEYVEGEPLSHVLRTARDREGGLAPQVVAFVLAETCDGLHAAHELRDVDGKAMNVIHRDVSPHNVMVAYEGNIKLLDFGVAKVATEKGVTRTGEVKGKTAYMSPEQAMGEPLDRRSDLYSVGALLFECVTGQKMWGNGTDLEVMRKLALEEPPRLDIAAPGTPPALCALHARLVGRAPADRPASARDVASELRAFLAASDARARTRTEVPAVAAMMARLFATESAARKSALNSALNEVAPSKVEALRLSLAGPTAFQAPSPPAQSAASPVGPSRASGAPTATRTGIIGSTLAGLALAVVIVAVMSAHGEGGRRSTAPSAVADPPSAASALSPLATASSPSLATARSPSLATASSPSLATARSPSTATTAPPASAASPTTAAPASATSPTTAASPATIPTARSPRPAPPSRPKPPPPRSGKLDVDPEPF